MTNANGNNQMIVAIVNLYFQVSETPTDKLDELAQNLATLIEQIFTTELRNSYALNLPYKDITDAVFCCDKVILSDGINNFKKHLENVITTKYEQQNPNKSPQTKKKYINRFLQIHNKLVEHTLLAQVQRDFIKKTIRDAKMIADQAKDTAENAQKIADKAEIAANNAQTLADKADKTYNSMFANYVTILGIFTAIIVTIFGGLNIINTVSKNIDNNIPVLMQLTALLMLCVILLLYFLARIIVWITNSKSIELEKLFYGIIIVCTAVIIIGYFIK